MAMRRNPGSNGDFYFVRDDVDEALTACDYYLGGRDVRGLRYLYNGKPIFFFSYYNLSTKVKNLPEIHILPHKKNNLARLPQIQENYKTYLCQIGKGSLLNNVVIASKGIEIKQPMDRMKHLPTEPLQMNWGDIKGIILNLHLVHPDAPTCDT